MSSTKIWILYGLVSALFIAGAVLAWGPAYGLLALGASVVGYACAYFSYLERKRSFEEFQQSYNRARKKKP